MAEKYVLSGAGSVSFTRGLVADILRTGKELELGLVDISPEALQVAEGLVRKMVAAKQAAVRVQASLDRRDVLAGAHAVICTVGVGGRRAWERDIMVPRKYGVFQPVGDTAMPGGLSRALRMIPAMVAVAEDVLDLCPEALFFNYGNPMTAVCRAIRKATGAPVVGLCHGVLGTAQYLAKFLNLPFDEVTYTAVGLNHMTWFTEFRHKGRDAWPLFRAEVARRVGTSPDKLLDRFAELGDDPAMLAKLGNPFSWNMFALYGAFPAVLDRHAIEFFPQLTPGGAYYGKTLGVDVFSMEAVIEGGDKAYERMRQIALSGEPLPPDYLGSGGGEHEQVISIIESIDTDAGRVYSANLPNRGQVSNLPPEAILESPAVANASGLHPLALGELPSGLAATLVSRIAVIETIVDAALKGSRELFVQALVADGSVASLTKAEQLADELLAAHAEHLPQFAGE
jgi:alpha-galactosidase